MRYKHLKIFRTFTEATISNFFRLFKNFQINLIN